MPAVVMAILERRPVFLSAEPTHIEGGEGLIAKELVRRLDGALVDAGGASANDTVLLP